MTKLNLQSDSMHSIAKTRMQLPGNATNNLATRRERKVMTWLGWSLSAVYVVACVGGIIPFAIWPSVLEFLGEMDPLLFFEKSAAEVLFSAWGIRTSIAMPSLLLAEFTPLSQPQSFGLFCGILLVVTGVLINSTAIRCFGSKRSRHEIPIMLVIFTLGYLMNGRLCSAFVGSALLLRSHVFWFCGQTTWRRTLFLNLLALPLLTVSSGTFMVGFMTVCVWLVFAAFDLRDTAKQPRFRPAVVLAGLPVVVLYYFQSTLFTTKATRYYRGDLVEMMTHGWGDMLHQYIPGIDMYDVVNLTLSFTPIALMIGLFLVGNLAWSKVYLIAAVLVSGLLGVFGHSTLLTNTPAALLCGVIVSACPRPRRTNLENGCRVQRGVGTH